MSNAIRSQGTKLQRGVASVITPKTISSITSVGIVNTLTTATAHTLNSGDQVTISGAVPAGYNGTYTISVTTATTFTFSTAVAVTGPATTMGVYAGNTYTYQDVEECSDIKIGGVQVSQIDVTHLQSLAKEFVAGLLDNGSVDFSCNFTNGTVQQLLRTDQATGTTSQYHMLIGATLPTPINFFFAAFVTKAEGPTAKVDGKMEMQYSAKITGAIVQA